MEPIAENMVMRKVTRRLIPFVFLLYIVASLDKVNVGFAKLEMNHLPWFSEAVYGFGAGIFFVGYFLFEVPSNLILQKVGARWWIARIMATWGIIAAAMMFVNSAAVFDGLRFMLGVAEAGFFPGLILYLTYWFTRSERAYIVGLLMLAVPVSGMIGGPVSGLLLQMNGVGGLQGWQWMFLLEGIPAVLLGVAVLAHLPNGPTSARWLSDTEKEWIQRRLEDDHALALAAQTNGPSLGSHRVAVLSLILISFAFNSSGYGISLWLPQIINGFGKLTSFQVGLLAAVPSAAGALCMVWSGAHSDRTRERKLHVAVSLFATATGLTVSAFLVHIPWIALTALSVANMGILATLGPFWALTTSVLPRSTAAAGIALINSLGNLGGFAGPFAVGWIKGRTHGYQYPLLCLAAMACFGGLVALSLRLPALRHAGASKRTEDT